MLTDAVNMPAKDDPSAVLRGSGLKSRKGDSQLARIAKSEAEKHGSVLGNESNAPPGYKPGKVLPIKAHYDPNDPQDVLPTVEIFPDDAPDSYVQKRFDESGAKLKLKDKKKPSGGRNKRSILDDTANQMS